MFAIAILLNAAFAPAADTAGVDQLEQQAFRAAVERVAPSVLQIETVGGLDRVGKVLFGTGPTTGLAVSPDGYIVSSAFNFLHKPASILVQLPDGSRKAARLVATDHNRMIVLLKIEVDRPLVVPEAAPESEIRVGQWAIAVGRAFEGKEPNMAVGLVSALNRVWGKAIQTDAAVSPNNYGGPLVDVRGRVLGVLVPMSPQDTSDVAGYEWYDSGIGFAVPLATILELLPRLKEGKDLQPGAIGIGFKSEALFMAEPVIAVCRPRSPARQAGLKAGDRIVEVGGRKVEFASHIKQEISRRYAGEKLKFVVERDGQKLEREIELVGKLPPYVHPFLGLLPARPLQTRIAMPEAKPGEKPAPKIEKPADAEPKTLAVRWVFPDSPAAKAGITAGDVIASIDGDKVTTAAELRAKLADREPGETVALEIVRQGKTEKMQVALAPFSAAAPAGELPAAHPAGKGGEKPAVGEVEIKVPDSTAVSPAYVPAGYDPSVPHGLVVWLHGPRELPKQAIDAWKPLCDRHELIVLAPKSSEPGRWQGRERANIASLMQQVAATYSIDPGRVVIGGEDSGGGLAATIAFAPRSPFAGLIVVDGPLPTTIPENEPSRRLMVAVAGSETGRWSPVLRTGVARLREMQYPLWHQELGRSPRPLSADERAELARWIDALDRI